MTRIEEIEQIKAEIARLNKRLEILESLPESMEERKLSSFEELHSFVRSLSYGGINTVEDLISSTPEELLKIRNIGKRKLEAICQWMQKYELNFI